MAGTGFHRDIANDELDIQLDGTVVCTLTTTSIALPTGPITLGGRGAATQADNHQTAVTINATSGIITLFSVDLAAGAESQFIVNNTTVAALDTVVCCVGVNGDAGEGFATVSDVDATGGAFSIVLYNPSGVAGFNGATTINFVVIKSVA